VNLHTFWISTVACVSGNAPSAASRRFPCGNSVRWPLFLLALLILNCFAFGPSIAASYEMPADHNWTSVLVPDPLDQPSHSHPEVLAAGFGFQAAGSSIIMVRTYDASTGVILSDDSFDLSIKEEGAEEATEQGGRIFAGGIGVDKNGKSKFMLSVYEAETGKFLWEGQLNLMRVGDEGVMKVRASVTPIRHSTFLAACGVPKAFDTLFSLRAVNPVTGGLIWEDQFAPGVRRQGRVDGVSIGTEHLKPTTTSIAHIFDLLVRTYDHRSGVLLWEDSFEQLDQVEESSRVPETNSYPQAIPFWSPTDGFTVNVVKVTCR